MPRIIPRMRPAKISVGKWTYKYILENAMTTATAKAAMPNFLWLQKIAVAAPIEASVWPDGKE